MLRIVEKIRCGISLPKGRLILVLAVIFLIGLLLRIYHFSDWIHFELDQARDAYLIQRVMDSSPGELPLLGPRAAGSFLRLGPMFYYIEYVFSVMFNNVITGSAWAVLFFSVLSLPAAFIFFKKGFSNRTSFILTAILSFSVFMVAYSRFAWNPNLLPFFILLLFWAILCAVDGQSNSSKRGWWLVFVAFLFGVLSQFHFLALIIVAAVSVVFLAIKRPKIKWQYWVGSVIIVLVLYAPFFANEYLTKGLNFKLFLSTISDKSQKSSYSFLEKSIRGATQNAVYFWVTVTGSQTVDFPNIKLQGGGDIQCDWYCRKHLGEGIAAAIFYIIGTFMLFKQLFALPKGGNKDFILLNVILFFVSFIVLIPLSYNFSPRFYLIVFPLPLVCCGLILDRIYIFLKSRIKFASITFFVLISILIFFNLFFSIRFLKELNDAKNVQYLLSTDRILKQKTRITLEQQMAIVKYIEEEHQKDGLPVIFSGQSEFHRSFAFHLDQRNVPRDGISIKNICRNANYYLIIRSQSDLSSMAKYFEKFDIKEQRIFGTLTVYHLDPKEQNIICEEFSADKFLHGNENEKGSARRYTWKDFLAEIRK